MRIGIQANSGSSEIIRSAEKMIDARDYEQAMEQLSAAQRLDPENIYINAIIERIHQLTASETGGGRLLTLTVGDEFDSGIKPMGDSQRTGDDLDTRVKKLTSKASELVRRGAYETAFDSLMNAYLLDPVSPVVIETERTLLPAIEMMRKRGTIREGSQSQRLNPFGTLPPSGRRPEASGLSPDDARRIEELKRQKESERLERERAMWREASRAPRLSENPLEPEPPQHAAAEAEPAPAPEPEKEPAGFFAKLRLGKLLG